MLRLAKLGRLFLALLIALALSVPSFAQAMPMPVGPCCAGHHASGAVKHALPVCAAAACVPVVAFMPAPPTFLMTSFHMIEHAVALPALRPGVKARPEPYPPRTRS